MLPVVARSISHDVCRSRHQQPFEHAALIRGFDLELDRARRSERDSDDCLIDVGVVVPADARVRRVSVDEGFDDLPRCQSGELVGVSDVWFEFGGYSVSRRACEP
jgi:hypothetical protein